MSEPDERFRCDQCGGEFSLQDRDFFEGPGSSWWCRCPHCNVLIDPDVARILEIGRAIRHGIARVLDDIAWPFYLPLEGLRWLGVMPPRWVITATVFCASPLQRAAIRLRGFEGVSGS